MAERRMFARSVVGSSRFLKLSVQARLLYFDLGMDADDDGYAEAFATMRKTGAKDKTLKDLENQGFIKKITDDPVVKIVDWTINNQIRKDRYHPSRYASPETAGQPSGTQW